MLVFNCRIRFFVFFLILTIGCTVKKARSSGPCFGYTVLFKSDPISEEQAYVLYSLLSESVKNEDQILWNQIKKDYKTIKVEISAFLEEDYCIDNKDKELTIKVKDKKNCLWLFNQLLKVLSEEEDKFYANDLPPAIIDFSGKCKTFDFAYREPHYPSNLTNGNHKILGTQTVEDDWGIWGHNIAKIVKDEKKTSLYARKSGKVYYEQFCFSSQELFLKIKEYILDNFGDGKKISKHFMIMPNDNLIVCECEMCLRKGNTSDNSSPAVFDFIKRLALSFPDHIFFTTAYGTSFFSPEDEWPENTGVMISTIDVPKGVELKDNVEIKKFKYLFNEWTKTIPTVYSWDYAANFDDYLTPCPVLYGFKKQLAFYKELGIKGVFLNASGYDYSPFEDVKTFVTAAILMDVEYSVDSLCQLYFDQFYPTSSELLTDFYLSLEKRMEKSDVPYNIYGGFEESLTQFLDIEEFITFYENINKLLDVAEEDEKERLEKLYIALSFTRLQLAYYQKTGNYGFADQIEGSLVFRKELLPVWKKLSEYTQFENFINYREEDGEISSYLKNWEKIIRHPIRNYLLGGSIEALSELEEDGQDLEILIDGVSGFDMDYHMGWTINSVDNLHLKLYSSDLYKAKKVFIRFLLNDRHHMYLPEKVELYKDGFFYKALKPIAENKKSSYSIGYVETEIDLTETQFLEIKICRNKSYRGSIVCDEILLY